MTRACERGFTLIEAMISMVILAVGVLGILSMQTASVGALGISQDFTHVLNIGERMLEQIRLDALRWTSSAALNGSTVLLRTALPATQTAGTSGVWMTIPDGYLIQPMGGVKVDRDFRPDPGPPTDWPLGFKYCVYFRLTWVNPPTALRSDVRVAWPKDEGNRALLADCVQNTANVTDIANVRSITLSTTLMVNNL